MAAYLSPNPAPARARPPAIPIGAPSARQQAATALGPVKFSLSTVSHVSFDPASDPLMIKHLA